MFFPSHLGWSKFIFLDGWQEAAVAHGSQFWDTLKKIQSLILMLRSVHIGCPTTTAVLWGLADQSWLGLYMMLQGELESWGINWTSFFRSLDVFERWRPQIIHIHCYRIFHTINHPFWGAPFYGTSPSSQSAWLSEVPICHLFGRFLSAIPSTKSTKAWDLMKHWSFLDRFLKEWRMNLKYPLVN